MRRACLATLVAAASSLTHAFLVPPEISAVDVDTIKALEVPYDQAPTMYERTLTIDCPGCPIQLKGSDPSYDMQSVESVLDLSFNIAPVGPNSLMLNGLQIYPLDAASALSLEPLTASQSVRNAENLFEHASIAVLGYAVSISHPVPFSTKDQLGIVEVHFEIVEVGDKFLDGIPSITITLLETRSEHLMIGDAVIVPPKTTSIDSVSEQECSTLLCRWRAIAASRLSQLKSGCRGKARPASVEESSFRAHPSVLPGHRRPHGARPNGGHHRAWRHHHHRHGGFSRFLRGIVMHIFIPVTVGIVVGITASLVGMVVGHILIFTWRLLFRRNSARYSRVQQEESLENNEQIKSFLEPPPQYEDAVINEKEEQ